MIQYNLQGLKNDYQDCLAALLRYTNSKVEVKVLRFWVSRIEKALECAANKG